MRKVIFGIAAASLLAATTFSTSADAQRWRGHGGWGHHHGWRGGGWWPLAAFAALPLIAGAAGAWGYGGGPYYAYGGPVSYGYGYGYRSRRCGCY